MDTDLLVLGNEIGWIDGLLLLASGVQVSLGFRRNIMIIIRTSDHH